MDVLEIDGASNRGVEDIRELREQVKFAPMKGKFKVYIIDEVHMLTKEAFNALLKTLEEPPNDVIFIFATTEIRRVPQTILSRVQRFDFKRISELKIREHLKYLCDQESIHPEPEALEILSIRADGSMRDALSLFDQVLAFAGKEVGAEAVRRVLGIPPEETYDELVLAITSQNKKACFETLEKFYHMGIDTFEILNGLSLYLRNLLFARQPDISMAALGLSESRFNSLRTLGGNLQDGDIVRYSKLVSDMLNDLRNAPNARLTLEMGIVKLASLDKMVSISKLLEHTLAISNPDSVKKKA
jgi:DNA polymerase-3 subunit gamma/tau